MVRRDVAAQKIARAQVWLNDAEVIRRLCLFLDQAIQRIEMGQESEE